AACNSQGRQPLELVPINTRALKGRHKPISNASSATDRKCEKCLMKMVVSADVLFGAAPLGLKSF
ncbi:MAG: hypothetical protein WD045_17795, partial [Pirellulaceae bacterium]